MTKDKHTCVIIQSSYIPWRGYFDLIRQADTFIFLDQVQFTRRDWRTRNKIITQQGPKWLTVPVKVKDTFKSKIFDVEIDSMQSWSKDHFMTISHCYAKSAYKDQILKYLEPIYKDPPQFLWQLNRLLIKTLWEIFSNGTRKKFIGDEDILLPETLDSNMRLIHLCKAVGANHYISGPSAKDYINLDIWKSSDINISFAEYKYPQYQQLGQKNFSDFEGAVSLVDTLMCLGPGCMEKALGI